MTLVGASFSLTDDRPYEHMLTYLLHRNPTRQTPTGSRTPWQEQTI